MAKLIRWLGIVVGGIVALVLLGLGTIYGLSSRRMSRTYAVPAETLGIPSDSASVARGAHLADAISKCTDCHGDDLGGRVFIDEQPFGRFVAPNLTGGSPTVSGWSDADWIRAIRHGVNPVGRPLVFMPSQPFSSLGASDLAAIIGYVKQVPPVTRELPKSSPGPIARLLFLTGKLPLLDAETIDHLAPMPADPTPGTTPEYGRYLAVTGGCTTCHGPDLAGGIQMGPRGTPASANISPAGIGSWSESDFTRALREGKRPNGSAINPFMPWTKTRKMTDDEILAVWAYLKTVPAKETVKR